MLSGSGASLSSWSNASSFDQASGFLNSTKGGSIFDQHIRNIGSRRNQSNASSIITSNEGDVSRGLRHGDGPIKYSWEYLAEGKESRLRKHDGLPSSKEQSERVLDKSSDTRADGTQSKNYDSSNVVTSAEKSNYSPRSTKRQQRRNQKETTANTNNVASKQNTRTPAIPAASTNVARTNFPTSPKLLKDLFHVVKNDSRCRARKVGRCTVCSTSYSIPYIERHITNKHPALILDPAADKRESSQASNQDCSRSSYLRPRVVITRIDSETKTNKNYKAKIAVRSEAPITTAKANTSQKTQNRKQSKKQTAQKHNISNKMEVVHPDSRKRYNKSNGSRQNRDQRTKRETTSKSESYNLKQKRCATSNNISTTNNKMKKAVADKKDAKSKKLKQPGNQAPAKQNGLYNRPKMISAKTKLAGEIIYQT